MATKEELLEYAMQVAGKALSLNDARATISLSQKAKLDEKAEENIRALMMRTGLKLRAEQRAMIYLCDALNMTGSSRNICHPETGDHHKLIESFADLACAAKPSDKAAFKKTLLHYFQYVTDSSGEHGHNLGYYYGQFTSYNDLVYTDVPIDWRKNRDEAYVSLAVFVKEMEAMRDYIRKGYTHKVDGESPDKMSLAKVERAEKFVQTAQLVFDAMGKTGTTTPGLPPGGISDAAKARAANATASFFPILIHNFPEVEKAAEILRPSKKSTKGKPENKQGQAPAREPVNTDEQQGKLLKINRNNEKLMTAWRNLWKNYGEKNTEGAILKGDSHDVVAKGLVTLEKELNALAKPSKQLVTEKLKTFGKQLESFAPALCYLNAVQPRMSEDERAKMQAITSHLIAIMTLVNKAHPTALVSPDIINSLTAAPAPAEVKPEAIAAPAETIAAPVVHRRRIDMDTERKALDRAADGLVKQWDNLLKHSANTADFAKQFTPDKRDELRAGRKAIDAVFKALENPGDPALPLNTTDITEFRKRLTELEAEIENTVGNFMKFLGAASTGHVLHTPYTGFRNRAANIRTIIDTTLAKTEAAIITPEEAAALAAAAPVAPVSLMALVSAPAASHTAKAAEVAAKRNRPSLPMTVEREQLGETKIPLLKTWDTMIYQSREVQEALAPHLRKEITEGIVTIEKLFDVLKDPLQIPDSTAMIAFQERLGEIISIVEVAVRESTSNKTKVSGSYDVLVEHAGTINDIIDATVPQVESARQHGQSIS